MASLASHSPILAFSIIFAVAIELGDGTGAIQTELVDQGLHPLHGNIDTNEKYLRLLVLDLPSFVITTRNLSGHIIHAEGVGLLILEWLASDLHFKYMFLPDDYYALEDYTDKKGAMSAIVEDRADLILTGVVLTASRHRNLNFPYPCDFGQYGFIIRSPDAQVDVAAVWKPFQRQVWIYFLVSLFSTIAFFYGISYSISAIDIKRGSQINTKEPHGKVFEDIGIASQYVLGVLLAQSILAQRETNRNQKLAIRFLAGAWCVTCFVLITAYSSVLISFVTLPYYKPLIDSIYDIPENPEVKITVDGGWALDYLLTSAESGIFKYLGDQLRRHPELRCLTTEQCLDKVRNGPYVYSMGYRNLKNDIGIDLKRTGRCDFTIAKKLYYSFTAGFALPKHVETEFYSRGILKAHEGGFISLWFDQYSVDASQCLNPLRKHKSDRIRLTIGGLSGAFVVLAFGYCLSAFAFISEIIYKRYS